jgi:hypothetical protein
MQLKCGIGHDKRGILAGYSVDAQGPRLPFLRWEVHARAGIGPSLDSGVRIGSAVGH